LTSENDCRFFDVVVLIAGRISSVIFLQQGLDYNPSTRKRDYFVSITKISDSPQSTHTTSLQNQRGLIQWLASPAHGECAEDVPMRNNQDVPFLLVWVVKAGTVIFLLDLGDQGVETADDIFG
jgi:hypothetical protein